jgi:hypothetical protein
MEICNDSRHNEERINQKYSLTWTEFIEIRLEQAAKSEPNICYRCGKPLEPLTYTDPDFYYLPCWNCNAVGKRLQKSLSEEVKKAIHDFYNTRILGDRYFQLFLVEPVYFKNTLPHQYDVFKKIVGKLKPPSRNDIWSLDWEPGYPHIISESNLKGLKIINITQRIGEIVSGKDKIKVRGYEILTPETSKYELHYSRYSLFNPKSTRKSRRIKVSDEKCYKLYDTPHDNVKAIFRIMKDGKEVDPETIPFSDFVVIKLLIMRNKSFLKTIFEIIDGATKHIGSFKDSVFLHNTVKIDPGKPDINLSLLWSSFSRYKDAENINLSIL